MGQASDLAGTVGEVHRGWYFEVRNSIWYGVESASVVFERVEMGGIRAAMLNLGLGLAGSMMRERNGVRG